MKWESFLVHNCKSFEYKPVKHVNPFFLKCKFKFCGKHWRKLKMPEIHIIKEKNKGLMIKACKVQGVFVCWEPKEWEFCLFCHLLLDFWVSETAMMSPSVTLTPSPPCSDTDKSREGKYFTQTGVAADASGWWWVDMGSTVSDRRRQIHQDNHMLIE